MESEKPDDCAETRLAQPPNAMVRMHEKDKTERGFVSLICPTNGWARR